MGEKNQGGKKRNWAFVLYPESAPENWKEIIQISGLVAAISPLHNKDTDPTGEPKKPHYHIILCYAGPTSYRVVNQFVNGKLGQPRPEPIEQVRGYYRYFTHKDNPEKAQYAEADIATINGFDIRDFIELTKSEVDAIRKQLTHLIIDEDIYEYSVFVDRTLKEDAPQDWYGIASTNTIFFNNYITSRRHKMESEIRNKSSVRRRSKD